MPKNIANNPKIKIPKEDIIRVIKESSGFKTHIVSKLKISKPTLDRLLRENKEVQAALDEKKEAQHDFVESKLLENIDKGHEASIFFYLKTQCKHRGYIERQEITGKGGGGISLIIEKTYDKK